MRAYGISVGILAAILVFSLWNSSYMTASTVRWREQLQQADAQAQSEAWTEAVDTLAGSYDDWSESQTYLHIVARHDTVDDAEAMGADAVINVRYGSSSVMQGAAEVIAYGTAVKYR